MSGVDAREVVQAGVRRELFGPLPGEPPVGTPIDCSGHSLTFDTKDATDGQFHDRDTLEEVLTRSDPLRRYGVGVLHSGGTPTRTVISGHDESVDIPGLAVNEEIPDQEPNEVRGRPRQDQADSDDFDLSDTNRRKQSAMALSFKVRVRDGGSLKVRVRGAYYDKIHVIAPDMQKEWWVRRPFVLDATASGDVLRRERKRSQLVTTPVVEGAKLPPRIQPSVSIFCRTVPGEPNADLRLRAHWLPLPRT